MSSTIDRGPELLRVFDLTGERLYRNLINWGELGQNVEALHVFGEQNAGPAVLPALGSWLASVLTADRTLLTAIHDRSNAKTPFETVWFSRECHAPSHCPDEDSQFASQLAAYCEPLLAETDRLLRDVLGRSRWQKLGTFGHARDFLTTGLSLYRMDVGWSDFSPICIQLSKTLETVLYDGVFFGVGRELQGYHPIRDRSALAELQWAVRNGRTISLGAMAELIRQAWRKELTSVREELRERILRPWRGVPSPDLLVEELRRIAATYRNGLAHTERADLVVASGCINSILGGIDENSRSLNRRGLLVQILDCV